MGTGGSLVACNGFRVVEESRREEKRDREGFSEVLERWA